LWDGRDQIPGTDAPSSAADPGLQLIDDLPTQSIDAVTDSNPAKAEGLALIEETSQHWKIMAASPW
jgi:hypothetical protein